MTILNTNDSVILRPGESYTGAAMFEKIICTREVSKVTNLAAVLGVYGIKIDDLLPRRSSSEQSGVTNGK